MSKNTKTVVLSLFATIVSLAFMVLLVLSISLLFIAGEKYRKHQEIARAPRMFSIGLLPADNSGTFTIEKIYEEQVLPRQDLKNDRIWSYSYSSFEAFPYEGNEGTLIVGYGSDKLTAITFGKGEANDNGSSRVIYADAGIKVKTSIMDGWLECAKPGEMIIDYDTCPGRAIFRDTEGTALFWIYSSEPFTEV